MTTTQQQPSRRTVILSALALAVAIVGGVILVAVLSDGGTSTQEQLREGEIPQAEAIPQPGRGRPPSEPGDRGGPEQLALLGVIVVATAGIGVVVFRGGRRARENRARWVAAGASGRDGALDT